MMPRYLLLTLLLLATATQAAVYKWVDEQGVVHYGDLPPSQLPAETMQLPEVSTPRGREAAPAPPVAEEAAAEPPAEEEPPFTGYTRIAISEPADGATLRANDQRVMVVVDVEPPLRTEHRVALFLDDRPVGPAVPGTQVELQGVFRGRHTLRAKIVAADGAVLGETDAISFNLRQASVLLPQRANPTP